MIHSSGTLSVNNSSTQVTGSGTLWLSRLTAGCVIYIDGSDKAYYVAKVVSDTELQLVIPFEEANKSGVPYIAVDDFTINYSYSYPRPNDVESATIMRRSLLAVDAFIDVFDARLSEVENPSGVYPAHMVVIPSMDTVSIPPIYNLTVQGMVATPNVDSVYMIPLVPPGVITADSDTVTADSIIASADGAISSLGEGLYFDDPQSITGIRLGSPLVFGDEPEDGLGLRFINPLTNTGIILGSPLIDATEPVPVQAPTVTNVFATGTTTAQVYYTDNQPIPADSFNVIVLLNGSPVQDNSTTQNPYPVTGLLEDTYYSIVMTATAGALTSPNSNTVNFKTDVQGQTGEFIPMSLLEMEGTVGQNLSGDDYMWNSVNTTYSQDQVRYGSSSARAFIADQSDGDGGWGGGLTPTILQEGRIGVGGEVWASMWLWVPTWFVAPGYNQSIPGVTCSELMKWMRWRKRRKSNPTENRGYLDLLVGNGKYRMASEFSDPGAFDAYVRDEYEWNTGTWQQWEWYAKLSNDSTGIMRLWNNGVLIAEDLSANQLAYSDEYISDFLLFSYYNCWSPQDQWLYIDKLVLATSESPPTNRDAAGNYIISDYSAPVQPLEGDLYLNTFETGTINDPQLNDLGVFSHYIYDGPSGEDWDSGASTDRSVSGTHSLKFDARYNSDSNNINGGKYEILWDVAQPDLYISYDTWVDSDWAIPLVDGQNHQKLLAIWSSEYSGDTTTPKKPWAVFETNAAENPTMRVTYQVSTDTTINGQTRGNTGVDDDENRATLFTAADKGKWINLKWHIKYSQSPTVNGVYELWKDGILVMRQNVDNHLDDDPNGGYRKLYLYGNAYKGLATESMKYIDNLKISTNSGDFVPAKYYEFNGTNGATLEDANAGDSYMWNAWNSIYTTDQAKYGSSAARFWIEEGTNGGGWGGGAFIGETVHSGDELWWSTWEYVPTWFITNVRGSEQMKWRRFRKRRPGEPSGAMGWLDMYIDGPAYNNNYAILSEYSDPIHVSLGSQANTADNPWATGTWVRWEWYVKLSHNYDGVARLWRDGVLIGERNNFRAFQYSDEYIEEFLYFNYFNDNSPQTQWLYVDNLAIATSHNPPTAQDAAGNYMIGDYRG